MTSRKDRARRPFVVDRARSTRGMQRFTASLVCASLLGGGALVRAAVDRPEAPQSHAESRIARTQALPTALPTSPASSGAAASPPRIAADAATLSARYAALEAMEDADVRAWVDEERAASARLFAEMPARAWFRARFAALSTRVTFGSPERQGAFYAFASTDERGRTMFALDAEPHAASPRFSVTENADGAARAIQAAPDGRHVAYARATPGLSTIASASASVGASPTWTWRIHDLTTGRDSADTIADARAGTPLIWSADSRQVFYVRAGAARAAGTGANAIANAIAADASARPADAIVRRTLGTWLARDDRGAARVQLAEVEAPSMTSVAPAPLVQRAPAEVVVFTHPRTPRLSLARAGDTPADGFIVLGGDDGRRNGWAWHAAPDARQPPDAADVITVRPIAALPGASLAFVARESERFLFLTDHARHHDRHSSHPPALSPSPFGEGRRKEGDGEAAARGTQGAAAATSTAAPAMRLVSIELSAASDAAPAVAAPAAVAAIPGTNAAAAADSPANWRTILASSAPDEAIEQVVRLGDRYAVRWVVPGRRVVRLHDRDGRVERELALPGVGTVMALSAGSPNDLFLQFSSYITPTGVYHYDVARNRLRLLRAPDVSFDGAAYETTSLALRLPTASQSLAIQSGAIQSGASERPARADGASGEVTLWMTSRRGAARDVEAPLLLYVNGYRGSPQTPAFAFTVAGWLDAGGRFAVLNLPPPGVRTHERDVEEIQQVLAALTRERIARPARVALHGGAAHGGALVATALQREPALAAASWTASGPMDLLALERQSPAPAWASEYGDITTAEGRARRQALSPLEAIGVAPRTTSATRGGTALPDAGGSGGGPATASGPVSTAVSAAEPASAPASMPAPDRLPSHLLTVDDPAVPAWHSYKFVAALNAARGDGRRDALLRQEPVGRGDEVVTRMLDERADVYAFFAARLGWQPGSLTR